jgi:CRP-like cAMP-binding protein
VIGLPRSQEGFAMSDDRQQGLELFLRRLLLRSALTPNEQDAIRSLPGRIDNVRAGGDVIVPGEHTDEACTVVRGLMSRFDTMLDGSRQTVALYLPGEMCDLHSVPVPTSGWGLEAVTDTRLLFVPHEALRRLTQNASLALALWCDTTVDGSILAKWVANMGRKQAIARVAHLFGELGMRMEQLGLGSRTEFELPMKQSQLAEVAGMTSVHVNRTLKALADRGVTFARGKGRIADWSATVRRAEFEPTYLLVPEQQKTRN